MKFEYTNYKNETEERDVDVLSIDYISNPQFGYAPGWFLTGRDRDRNGQVRSFRIDERMRPLGPAMHRHPGLTLREYPITEGHEVRKTVEQLQAKAVEREIEAAAQHHGLPAKNTEQTSAEVASLAAKYLTIGSLGPEDLDNVRKLAASALTQRG